MHYWLLLFLCFPTSWVWVAGLGEGEAIGLTGSKLIIAIVVNSVLSAIQAAGIGMYAPSMALVYIFGMSPRVAFPIMMTSAAFALPSASIKSIKECAYNRKATLAMTLSGVAGVFIAAFIVSLPLATLTWLVIAVIVYTAISLLLRAASKK